MVETLNDFLKLQEKQKSDIDEFEGLCLSMPLDLLAQAFSLNPLTRRFYVKAWMDALGQALHKKLKLTAGEENEAPYMLEEGVLTLPKGIYSKPGLLFISLVHESSHFVLASSPKYEVLKRIDKEYKSLGKGDEKMLSPIEYYANTLSLALMEQALERTKNKKAKAEIPLIRDDLKKQLGFLK